MRDVLGEIRGWYDADKAFALATVVHTYRSAPRQPGAAMGVASTGEVVGSVSGGCVEGAVYDLGNDVLATGEPVLAHYGVSDSEAFAVGLTCGGEIDIFVEAIDPQRFLEFSGVAEAIDAHAPVALATVVSGPIGVGTRLVVWPDRVEGSLGEPGLDVAVVDDAQGMLAGGATGLRHYGLKGERRMDEIGVFIHSYAPPPRMLVFGAIDYAAAVARIGNFLGYHVTVCDARPVFATKARFPGADEVVVEWPHRFLEHTTVDERTVICVLTHDPKFDVPLLEAALRTPASFIGVMGSRRTHTDRLDRLRERGVSEDDLRRIAAPVGLDIGASTPEETAVSVAAEMVALRTGASGRRLTETSGRIHGPWT